MYMHSNPSSNEEKGFPYPSLVTTIGSDRSQRLIALRRFAIAITVLNVLGHFYLGFEQSWAQPLVALITAYSLEILLEVLDARITGRTPGFSGRLSRKIDFLLSAHISALAVAMLLYANDRLWVIAFATAVAIGSKSIFRVSSRQGSRHFFNPSNLGLTATLLLFPWVGIVPPYHFTENLEGAADWLLPAVIVGTGSFLNARLTKRIPLIAGWLIGFLIQAAFRSLEDGSWRADTSLSAGVTPMTGTAFVLFTFYMITDPATTPSKPMRQIVFGASVAVTYCVLMILHTVFTLFFALTIVCAMRGLGLCSLEAYRYYALSRAGRKRRSEETLIEVESS